MQPLQPGDPRTVGPYVLIARLGSGGMGHVFLGRTRGGRTVAVKAIKPELAGNPEFRRRFRQEVAAARLVSGPHTAPVVDADPEAAMPWLATAYVSGQTLRAAVAEGWRLPEASLLVLAGGLARALAEIHAAGVVHRDLKPSNVMLAVEGPRVIDFGISRVTAATDYTRTDVGTIVGSPGFMSPEQSRGHSLTGATDVFSLGTVLAYAATGHNPFGSGPDHALLYRISHADPDLDGVPARLVPLIRACLEKDAPRRPSTAQIVRHTAAPPAGPWLPAALTAAIAQDAAEILDYEGAAAFPGPDTAAGNRRRAGGGGRHAAPGVPEQAVGVPQQAARTAERSVGVPTGTRIRAPTDMPAGPGTRRTRVEPPSPETLMLPPQQAARRRSEPVGGEAPRRARAGGDRGRERVDGDEPPARRRNGRAGGDELPRRARAASDAGYERVRETNNTGRERMRNASGTDYERVRGGEPPNRTRGGGSAGWVIGVLAAAVIAALSTALVMVLRHSGAAPGTAPTASVTGGASTSATPLTRSGHAPRGTRSTTASAPAPTSAGTTSQPAEPVTSQSPTTAASTGTTPSSSPGTTPSPTPSPTPISTPSSSPSAPPSSSASHSPAPTSTSPSHTTTAARRGP